MSLWPSPAASAAELRPTCSGGTRKLRLSFVRTLRSFAAENTCSWAKVRDLRTRCNQWTRSQRIRTAAAIPISALIVDAGSIPVFVQIAARAGLLRDLGMSDRAIGRALGVSDKTIAKAIASIDPARSADTGSHR